MKPLFYLICLIFLSFASLQAQKLSFYHQLGHIYTFRDAYHIATSIPNRKETPNIICDGSVATLIIYSQSNPMSTNYRLKIKEDLQSFTDMYGRIESLQYKEKENLLIAKYRHPIKLEEGKTLNQLTMQVYKPGRGKDMDTIIYESPINIFNTPVLALSSVFGNSESYALLLPAIQKALFPTQPPNGKYPIEATSGLIFLGNFENTSDVSLKQNENIVKRQINAVIFSLRKAGFIAGKVDLITYGISGLLARQWLQNKDYQNNIKRLITISTPHSGTQLADLILSNHFFSVSEYPLRKLNNLDITQGAIENLRVNSKALSALNRAKSQNKVPSHSISGVDEVSFLDGYFGMALVGVAGILQGKYEYLFNRCENQDKIWVSWRRNNQKKFNALLPYYDFCKANLIVFDDKLGNVVSPKKILEIAFDYQPNDGFSMMQSQSGGLQSPFNSVLYRMPYHRALSDNNLTEIIPGFLASHYNYNFSEEGYYPELLNTKKLEELFAFMTGLHNIERGFIENNNNPQSIEALENESVVIMSPKGGDTFKPGETVQIVVKGTDSVSAICISAIALSAPDNGTFSNYTNQKSATFGYKIPQQAVGPVKILIRGYLPVADTSSIQFTKVDTVTINIIPQATIKSLEFDNEAITLVKGEKRGLKVFANYSDNVKRNITNLLTNSNFKSEKTSIVQIKDKNAEGLKAGESEVVVTFNSITAATQFTIVEPEAFDNADTTLSVDDNDAIFVSDRNFSDVFVYPNPSTGLINIEFSLFKPSNSILKISDINGKIVSIPFNGMLNEGIHRFSINFENYNSGVYFYSLTDGITSLNGIINLIK